MTAGTIGGNNDIKYRFRTLLPIIQPLQHIGVVESKATVRIAVRVLHDHYYCIKSRHISILSYSEG
ncbi:hypothetical protein AG1IA_00682 [Rhizoctonia solani AG-1 IA]|nr:hypothetical protein AG1IA_00682 [Rhizoctonia solani AG-1 IA]